jgi:hypothetical protein
METDTNEPAAPAESEFQSARVLLEVVAGVLPGTPLPEYTRRWAITSAKWRQANDEGEASELLAEYNGRAQGYAALLMLQPDAVNWVRTDWIWT